MCFYAATFLCLIAVDLAMWFLNADMGFYSDITGSLRSRRRKTAAVDLPDALSTSCIDSSSYSKSALACSTSSLLAITLGDGEMTGLKPL